MHAGRYPNQQYSLCRCSRLPPLSFSLFFSSVHLISSHGLLLFASHVLMLLFFSSFPFRNSLIDLYLCSFYPLMPSFFVALFLFLIYLSIPFLSPLLCSLLLILLNLALHSMQPLSFPYTICFFLLLPFFLSSSPLINTFDFHISSITSGGEMDRIILMCVCAFLKGHGCN